MRRRGLRIWIGRVSCCSLRHSFSPSASALPFPVLVLSLAAPFLDVALSQCRSCNVVVAPHRGFWGRKERRSGFDNWARHWDWDWVLHNIPVILREGEANSRHICGNGILRIVDRGDFDVYRLVYFVKKNRRIATVASQSVYKQQNGLCETVAPSFVRPTSLSESVPRRNHGSD